jgi:poly-gamma-glutamate synthesis protein (capsule biosynthesis protein)
LQLLCIGDVALQGENLPQGHWIPPGELTPGEDVKVLFNWELPIGTVINPMPRSSGPRLLASTDSLRLIRRWSPGFASLATNHILDAGEEGLTATMDALNQAGFVTVGAGRTREEITRPLFWETTEGRLAIINWVFPETHPDWMSVPGPNCWPGPEEAKHTIQGLKGQADWVLISVHWSDELFPYPRSEDRVIARYLAQMGADVVVGHHPHVVRGIEVFNACPVFYSIGNFYFSDLADGHGGWIIRAAPRNREGLGVGLTFQRGRRPEYRILSFWQTPKAAVLDSIHRAVRRVERAGRPLKKLRESEYVAWYSARRARFDRWDYRWHFGVWNLGIRGMLRRLLSPLGIRRKTPLFR